MKDILTESELRFLRSQGLGPDDVMDVRRMSQWHWFRRIKEEGKSIALGSKCRKAGHRLRSTKGHCVQCDTKVLAFAGRFNLKQYLYIAGSLKAQLIKIGVCKDLSQRLRQICAERHGDARDWEVIYAVKIERAGELEDRVLTRLGQYSIYSPTGRMGSFSSRSSFESAQLARPWKLWPRSWTARNTIRPLTGAISRPTSSSDYQPQRCTQKSSQFLMLRSVPSVILSSDTIQLETLRHRNPEIRARTEIHVLRIGPRFAASAGAYGQRRIGLTSPQTPPIALWLRFA